MARINTTVDTQALTNRLLNEQDKDTALRMAQAQLAVVREAIEENRSNRPHVTYGDDWIRLAAAMDEAAEKARKG
jgi:hypothetical protein